MEVPIGVLIDAYTKYIKALEVEAKGKLSEYNKVNNGNIFTRSLNLHKPLNTLYDKRLYSNPRRGGEILEQIKVIMGQIVEDVNDVDDLISTRMNLGDEIIIQVEPNYRHLLPYIEHEFEVVY